MMFHEKLTSFPCSFSPGPGRQVNSPNSFKAGYKNESFN